MKRQRETPEAVAALYLRIIRAENNGRPAEEIQAMREEHAARRKRLHQQEVASSQVYHTQYEARKARMEAIINDTEYGPRQTERRMVSGNA